MLRRCLQICVQGQHCVVAGFRRFGIDHPHQSAVDAVLHAAGAILPLEIWFQHLFQTVLADHVVHAVALILQLIVFLSVNHVDAPQKMGAQGSLRVFAGRIDHDVNAAVICLVLLYDRNNIHLDIVGKGKRGVVAEHTVLHLTEYTNQLVRLIITVFTVGYTVFFPVLIDHILSGYTVLAKLFATNPFCRFGLYLFLVRRGKVKGKRRRGNRQAVRIGEPLFLCKPDQAQKNLIGLRLGRIYFMKLDGEPHFVLD